jgi:hypothetical protein
VPDQRNPNISKELFHWTAEKLDRAVRHLERGVRGKSFHLEGGLYRRLRWSSGIRRVAGERARHASTAGYILTRFRTN